MHVLSAFSVAKIVMYLLLEILVTLEIHLSLYLCQTNTWLLSYLKLFTYLEEGIVYSLYASQSNPICIVLLF